MTEKTVVNPYTGEAVSQNHVDRLGRRLTPWGAEILDPTPIAPPVGYKRQPTMVDHIRAMVRSERLAQEALAAGKETFEESEDFDDPDDPDDLTSNWENEYDPPVSELVEAVEAEKRRKPTSPKAPASESPVASPEATPAPSESVED